MRAFVVMPFGKKPDSKGVVVDFDAVLKNLIDPALTALDYEGRTTGDIVSAGNIRTDMFRLLITADLVIADISIHNANVYYELGIRHALRDKRTFLIRCQADEKVFDLQTERYLTYDRNDPGAALPQLIEGLRQTGNSDNKDSPVFLLLPNLDVPPSSLLVVPQDFGLDVERAKAEKNIGDLDLFANEVDRMEWEHEGLRVVGRAQFDLKAFEGAKVTWERLREFDANDLEANTLLATIYQRLGDHIGSEQAIRRALGNKLVQSGDRAELQSLVGRNAKARWLRDWQDKAELELRLAAALRSTWLRECLTAYSNAFDENLNHFYSGLNALAMMTVEAELAKALPRVWDEQFAGSKEARSAQKENRSRAEKLGAAVDLSLAAAGKEAKRIGKTDIWMLIGRADLSSLTSARPSTVALSYKKALALAPDFAVDSARTQLKLYEALGIRTENVRAALDVFPSEPEPGSPQGPLPRILLFTGHRIDSEGRASRRFPADKELVARDAIKKAIEAELAQPGGVAFGIAGAASGGDILFHEVCDELQHIPTRLFLAIPPADYVKASVASGGPQWVERFYSIYDSHKDTRRQLASSEDLPRWLRGKKNYDIWQRNNLWTLHNALALGRNRVTLIALWDGEKGDGPGGTEHMLTTAKDRGAKTIVLDTKKLFRLEG